MKRMGVYLMLAVLAAGCAQKMEPQILDPGFAARGIRQVALAPVVFADEPLDRYFGVSAAAEIEQQALRELQAKGYAVVLAPAAPTGHLSPPLVAAGTEPDRIAPAVPSGSDAVLQIRIDHFLDAGITDERSRIPLDIYATAALIDRNRQVLWQGEGRGQGAWMASSRLGPEDYFTAAASLADSLLATLPPASGGER